MEVPIMAEYKNAEGYADPTAFGAFCAIEKEEKPTLLNYGFLDLGLYYLCNIQPTTKYFTGLNGDFIDLQTEQQRIVSDGEVTFVVYRNDNPPQNIDVHYTLVYTYHEKTIWNDSVYYLYKLK